MLHFKFDYVHKNAHISGSTWSISTIFVGASFSHPVEDDSGADGGTAYLSKLSTKIMWQKCDIYNAMHDVYILVVKQ